MLTVPTRRVCICREFPSLAAGGTNHIGALRQIADLYSFAKQAHGLFDD